MSEDTAKLGWVAGVLAGSAGSPGELLMPIKVISYNCPECKKKFAFESSRDEHVEKYHLTSVADKILGMNAWNNDVVNNHSRVLGHKPDLDTYDRLCR